MRPGWIARPHRLAFSVDQREFKLTHYITSRYLEFEVPCLAMMITASRRAIQ